MAADRAQEREPIKATERVAEEISQAAWTADASQWWNKQQRGSDNLVSLPTLHVGDSRLNMYENYRVDSDVAQTYMKNRPAIVRINTMDPKSDASFATSAGSGSIIDPTGIIATGYHVVKNATALRVKTADGVIYEAKILEADPAKDEALIQIKSKNPWAQFPTVKLANDSNAARPGKELLGLGHPKNQDALHVSVLTTDARMPLSALQIKDGLLLGEDRNRMLIKAKGAVQTGDSGGPAFDPATGEQIGIINLSDVANGNAYVTPVEDLYAFLARTKERHGIASLPTRSTSSSFNTIGSLPSQAERTGLPTMGNPFAVPSIGNASSGLQNLQRMLSK